MATRGDCGAAASGNASRVIFVEIGKIAIGIVVHDGKAIDHDTLPDDAIMRSVKQTCYPVRKYLSMYWAYLGPAPAPEIPRYDA